MRTIPLFSLMLTLCLTSCDRFLNEDPTEANWLVGTWILDREKTMEALAESTLGDKANSNLAGKIAAVGLQKSAEAILKPMDNVKYIFTENAYCEKVGKYDRKMKTYEIISRPGRKQIQTKDEEGITNVYHLDDLNVWFYLRGNDKMKIYLRASN